MQSSQVRVDGVEARFATLEKSVKNLKDTGVFEQINEQMNIPLIKFIDGGLAGIGWTYCVPNSSESGCWTLYTVSKCAVSSFCCKCGQFNAKGGQEMC